MAIHPSTSFVYVTYIGGFIRKQLGKSFDSHDDFQRMCCDLYFDKGSKFEIDPAVATPLHNANQPNKR
jgi:hypothetical protein